MQKDTMVDIWGKNRNHKFLIAGPCVITSLELCIEIAEEIKRCSAMYGFYPIFKASYDKANRTSGNSYRGVGMEIGLKILSDVREYTGLKVITDVHETEDVINVSKYVDFLQVPAFLSRQTDLIEACAYSGLPTLVKKGQFLSPEACSHIEKKFYKAGGSFLMIAERGNSFGYNDLVVDATSISRIKKSCPDSAVIMDCTHSLQKPNGISGKTEGRSDLIEDMVRFASVMDANGLFIETHPNPTESPSDSENMLELSSLDGVLKVARKIYDCRK
jgi:2-dehydro-3-deoxyphosphooctonate aldolase (KDO 8-P synthase)